MIFPQQQADPSTGGEYRCSLLVPVIDQHRVGADRDTIADDAAEKLPVANAAGKLNAAGVRACVGGRDYDVLGSEHEAARSALRAVDGDPRAIDRVELRAASCSDLKGVALHPGMEGFISDLNIAGHDRTLAEAHNLVFYELGNLREAAAVGETAKAATRLSSPAPSVDLSAAAG